MATLSELFAGKIRRPPRWGLVRELVDACVEHAKAGGIDLPEDLGAPMVWRRRHEDLVRALNHSVEQRPAGDLHHLLRLAPGEMLPTLGGLNDAELGVRRSLSGANGEYLDRPQFDEEMRSMLALTGPPYPFVLAYGQDGAGKTRSAVEALRTVFPEQTSVLIPSSGAALGELSDRSKMLGERTVPSVIWMDDLSAADLEHANADLLEQISEWAVLAGTITADRCSEIMESEGTVARAALSEANLVHLPLDLNEVERANAAWYFKAGVAPRSFADAAEVDATRDMLLRLNTARPTEPVGACLVHAATACWRAGLKRDLTRDELHRVLPAYSSSLDTAEVNEEQFEQALHWAQAPAVGGRPLLERLPAGMGEPRWRPAPELVATDETRTIPRPVWHAVIDMATPAECAVVGREASIQGVQDYAVEAFTKAETDEDYRSYALLGRGQAEKLLGFHRAAKESFGKATEAEDLAVRAEAFARLADLLNQEGDLRGAEQAWLEAAANEHEFFTAMANHQIGLMRVSQQDFLSAEFFFIEATASEHPELAPRSWAMIATLREVRGDACGALEAYDRAAAWDNPDVRDLLEKQVPELRKRMSSLAKERLDATTKSQDAKTLLSRADRLLDLEDLRGALAAFQLAAQCEDPETQARALFDGGRVHAALGQTDEACAAFERAAECNVPHYRELALFHLGVLLEAQGDDAEAHRIWSIVTETGVTDQVQCAAFNLGQLELRTNNHPEAITAFQLAAETQDAHLRAHAALNLALLGEEDDAPSSEVDAWYRTAVETQDSEFMPMSALALGGRLADRGRTSEARELIKKSIESGDSENKAKATMILGRLQENANDEQGAAALYRRVIEFKHSDYSVEAHLLLGGLSERTGREDAARWHLRAAFDAGHPEHSPAAGLQLGRIHLRHGEYHEATVLLRQLRESRHPHVVEAATDMLEDLEWRPDQRGGVG
ncbi:tetratricopeptide repeat protein [Streptomyces tendae]|uniref:tetratricopeptide repeat protein n=1 Tax=Streptomyces tendae TaxID=1932 RepID=UPI00365E69CE